MRTRSSSNLPVVSPPNLSTSNPKRRNRRRSKQAFILEESPVDTMADQRTMAELLRAPTEGYAEAIMAPRFLLSNSSSSTAWDRYKDLLRACPHHGFTELHQLDTFYNALNPADQDSLNAVAGGNLLERRTQDVLTIIENKSTVRNSRNKSVVSQVKSCNADSNSSSEIAKLTHAVDQQTSDVTTSMTAILKQFQATPPPASVKAVEEICVTCGGAHPYYQCLAAGGNTFPELRDNIQRYVALTAVNYNQGNSVYRPPGMANQIRPSGFAQPNVQNNQNRFSQPQGYNRGWQSMCTICVYLTNDLVKFSKLIVFALDPFVHTLPNDIRPKCHMGLVVRSVGSVIEMDGKESGTEEAQGIFFGDDVQ
nr:hypothetical protein [Tanacetum cinerariifolium]